MLDLRCYLLVVTVILISTKADDDGKTFEEVVKENLLESGSRSMEDILLVKEKLKKLRKETRRALQANTRALAFSNDDVVELPNASKEPTTENVFNRKSLLSDVLYQGDIAMTAEQLDAQLATARGKRTVRNPDGYTPWNASQPVPYYFHPSLDTRIQGLILQGMKYWEDNSCIKFKEDRSQTPTIKIFQGSGCWSYVGRQSGAEQELSIGAGCEMSMGVVCHELAHAMGFFHEHSRPDRDDFITLDTSNIQPNYTDQFNKETTKSASTLGSPYEYASVMHYAADLNAINSNIAVMIPREPRHKNTMGQRMRPSFLDIQQMNKLYNCEEKCTGQDTKCQNLGFPNPNNCSRCICPPGFGGDLCDQREAPTTLNKDCGTTVVAGATWTKLEGSVTSGTMDNEHYLYSPESCWWHITAPEGKKVSLHFDSFDASGLCYTGCGFANLELKLNQFDRGGFRICCPEDVKKDFQSDDNIALVGAYTKIYNISFVLYHIAF